MMVQFSDEPRVTLQAVMGDDLAVARAAWVSTNRPEADMEDATPEKLKGLINYLMKARHGSPFEHGVMTFYVAAPIFVFREFHRHRIASYNEMSGRYTTLPPEFYMPRDDRPLINVGTSARPEFAPGKPSQIDLVQNSLGLVYEHAWDAYQTLLAAGIANEVARMVLPVGIFSQMYATMNLRSLMNFFSLRVDSPDSAVRSRPMKEIQMVAERMEAIFKDHFPIVHEAFVKNGRLAP